jgi:hypothetical protein
MININGKSYSGNNIVVNNNQVIIDGKNVTDEHKDNKVINITVNGNLNVLDVDVAETVTVNGECGNVEVVNGNINCGNVKGGVKTVNGDVEAGYVEGGISTVNGDVEADTVHGEVKSTNGDISR